MTQFAERMRRQNQSLVASLHDTAGVVARFTNRRILNGFFSRFLNRRIAFTLAAIPVFAAKFAHIYAHAKAVGFGNIVLWGFSFLLQDTAFLILLRILLEPFSNVYARFLTTTLSAIVVFITFLIGATNLSFFIATGSEVHWRNVGLLFESLSSFKVALSGLISILITEGVFFALAWVFQDIFWNFASAAYHVVLSPFKFLYYKVRKPVDNTNYAHLPQHENDEAFSVELKQPEILPEQAADPQQPATPGRFVCAFIVFFILAQIAVTIIRPHDEPLIFMSWTLVAAPIVDFATSASVLDSLVPHYGNSVNNKWDTITALDEPANFEWWPTKDSVPGFEDWSKNERHYSASKDPLKVSNIEDDLLPELKKKLAGVSIRHVVLLKLESTRKDIFPLKKDGYILERFTESYKNKTLPEHVSQRLSKLTPTANFITGDYKDGFEHKDKPQRGGINCNNAFTTATYTLKSLTGTLCGVTPLVEDFNVEYQHHVYQPCLPQIFDMFNKLPVNTTDDHGPKNFTSFPWRSTFMQSTTMSYDKQDIQMPTLGYAKENIINKEYVESETARFGPIKLPDVNYYGPAEIAIEKYFRAAFTDAKEKDERVFLSHLTSTSHHPFGIPQDAESVEFGNNAEWLNKYTNAIGYVDGWLKKILDILEETGVADETLVVYVGDHGLSVAENDAITPYHAPNIANFNVPLVFSHPKLPPINIDTQVESLQILPTILDLLRTTDSLSPTAGQAALDLASNYEGQSLIRPMHASSDVTAEWQFTVMNPGKSLLSVRNAKFPEWRVCLPLMHNVEWRFTNVQEDPHEKKPVVSFTFTALLKLVEEKQGIEAAKWVEEAAFVTRWWVRENRKRYRYRS